MIKYLQLPTCKLAEFADSAATVFTVSGFLYNDGVTPVATTDIGDICYATLEPKTAREELISFTIDSVTAEGVATITAVRGLLQKSPYGVGGASFDHQNGSDMVISNNPGLFNQLTAKDNAEVITEQWSFPEPVGDTNPATKGYVASVVSLGAAEATDLVRGVVRLSESPAVAVGTCTISVATPAVITFVAHGLVAGDSIKLTTTGALPTGLTAATTYFVIAAGLTANTFQVSATLSGSAINTTGTQSGVHTLTRWTPVVLGAKAKTVQFINAITGMISMYASATPPTGFLLCNGQAVSRTTYADLFAVTSTTYGVGDGVTTFNVPDLRSSVPVGYGQKTKAFTFLDANVNTGTDVITVTSNKFLYTGQAVVLSNSGGALPTGLSATTYYVIYVSDTTIKLATSRANADDGTAVDITAASGGGTHTLTLTMTSRALGNEGGEESHTISTEELASHRHAASSGSEGSSGGGTYLDDSGTGTAMPTTGDDTPHNNMPPFVVVNYIIKY